MRIVFFPVGNYYLPSSRYRCYFLAEELKKHGVTIKIVSSPLPLYFPKPFHKKAFLHIKNITMRFIETLKLKKGDIMYIQKGILQPGIYQISLFSKKILNKKMVFDFDDAIFLQAPKKVRGMVKICDAVIVSSHFLKEYAEKYNNNVFLIPTSIDTTLHKPIKKDANLNIVIGWIGLPGNLKYLTLLIESFKVLGKKYDIEFRVITDINYKNSIPKFENIKVRLIQWSLKTEWEEISKFDIGVMPLFNGDEEKGKCAFKALQYMTLGVPAVCSAVGETNYIIKDGVNGFLCENAKEWIYKLSLLIEDEKLKYEMGKNGRKTVEEKYSLEVNSKKFAELIRKIYDENENLIEE